MPKVKQSISNKLNEYVRRYPDFKMDGSVLFCKVCSKSISGDKIFALKQHLESAKYIEVAGRNGKKSKQQLIEEQMTLSTNVQFASDLCNTFIAAYIPLYNVRHKESGISGKIYVTLIG